MISLKKYMDGDSPAGVALDAAQDDGMLLAALAAYGAAMVAMSNCSLDACPGLGDELKQQLGALHARLLQERNQQTIQEIDSACQGHLRNWGQRAARYHSDKASEVKELLLAMARTTESVSARDQRCANQMNQVTNRLEQIATLDDVTQIRLSVEKGAADLKHSIERMTAEGKAAVEELRKEVKTCQAKLEEAEEQASRDSLTGMRSRMFIENTIDKWIAAGSIFCVCMIDLDRFKVVNDTYGHPVGDELLKLFSGELRSACRSTDAIGRWGGDEFILLLDCDLREATGRVDRLSRWVCGDYAMRGKDREVLKLSVKASFGLADHRSHESVEALIARADSAMYERKAAAHVNKITVARPVLQA